MGLEGGRIGARLCVVGSCEADAVQGEVHCKDHLPASYNGDAATPSVREPALEASVAPLAAAPDPGPRPLPGSPMAEARAAGVPWGTGAQAASPGVPDAPQSPERQAAPQTPDMGAMEPHWDGTQWVLRPKATDTRARAEITCPVCNAALAIELTDGWT